jgi:hypothetical protein
MSAEALMEKEAPRKDADLHNAAAPRGAVIRARAQFQFPPAQPRYILTGTGIGQSNAFLSLFCTGCIHATRKVPQRGVIATRES